MKRLVTFIISAVFVTASVGEAVAQSRSGNVRSNGGNRQRPQTQKVEENKGNDNNSQAATKPQQGVDGKVQQGTAGKSQNGNRNAGATKPSQPVRSGANVPKQPERPQAGRPQAGKPQPGAADKPQNNRPQAGKPQAGNQGRPSAGDPRPGNRRPGDSGRPQPGGPGHPSASTPSRPGDGRPQAGYPAHGPERHGRPLPPAMHEPIRPNEAMRFWDNGRHHFGRYVHSLPARYERRVYSGIPYYICDGIFYRLIGGVYYVSRPPYGIEFSPSHTLSLKRCRFVDGSVYYDGGVSRGVSRLADRMGLRVNYANPSVDYYYDDGVFFYRKRGRYVTAVPPSGAIVEYLSDDYDVIYFDDAEYYLVYNTVYRAIAVDGRAFFEVIGQYRG